MRSKRSRFALIGILALALCVTVGMLGGAAEAKKKGGGGGKKTLNFKTGAIPDAVSDPGPGGTPPGVNGANQLGIFTSCKKVGTKASAKIKETTFELSFVHNDTTDVQVLLAGPKGVIEVVGFEGNVPPPGFGPNTVFGPATFKDDALLSVDDHDSTADGPGFEAAGSEAFAPYVGEFKPASGTLDSLGSKTGGTWCVVAIDADGPADFAGDTAQLGSLTEAKLKFKTKG